MFHRLLVPIKPEARPHLGLKTLARLARASNVALIFVAVAGDAGVLLTGRSAALVLDVAHERRDLATSALRWVREHLDGDDLDVQALVVKGNVVDAVLAAANEHACDGIVLTQRPSRWPTFLTGRVGDTIARKSAVPVIVLAPDPQ
jgi:nucleotide-binding universal stress UspA family protein